MVRLNTKQLTAIARFQREFAVKFMELEDVDDTIKKILVRATLNTKNEKVKAFYLDDDGGLAGVVKE